MTNEESIKHCKEVAKELRKVYGLCPHPTCDGVGKCRCCINDVDGCLHIAKDNEQLAEWLEELVVLRKAYELACNEIEIIPEFFIYNAKEKLQNDKR